MAEPNTWPQYVTDPVAPPETGMERVLKFLTGRLTHGAMPMRSRQDVYNQYLNEQDLGARAAQAQLTKAHAKDALALEPEMADLERQKVGLGKQKVAAESTDIAKHPYNAQQEAADLLQKLRVDGRVDPNATLDVQRAQWVANGQSYELFPTYEHQYASPASVGLPYELQTPTMGVLDESQMQRTETEPLPYTPKYHGMGTRQELINRVLAEGRTMEDAIDTVNRVYPMPSQPVVKPTPKEPAGKRWGSYSRDEQGKMLHAQDQMLKQHHIHFTLDQIMDAHDAEKARTPAVTSVQQQNPRLQHLLGLQKDIASAEQAPGGPWWVKNAVEQGTKDGKLKTQDAAAKKPASKGKVEHKAFATQEEFQAALNANQLRDGDFIQIGDGPLMQLEAEK